MDESVTAICLYLINFKNTMSKETIQGVIGWVLSVFPNTVVCAHGSQV
jgi:hypothetical protein